MGRPNVGKSTLLNRLLKKRASITLDESGMTRDVLTYPCQLKKKAFTLVDTGGVFFSGQKEDFFQQEIENRVQAYVDQAACIVFLVDSQAGVRPYDEQIAKYLQTCKEKVLLVVNKIDEEAHESRMADFYALGFDQVMGISAAHGRGTPVLERRIVQVLPEESKVSFDAVEDANAVPKVSILGQPNVGKSSLINALVGEERVIVSEQAGTTRDVVQVPFVYSGNDYCLLDTAGLRRKSKVKDPVEFFSGLRAREAITQSDICLLMIDATDGFSQQDKRIIQLMQDAYKPMIFVVNKWDLMPEGKEIEKDFVRYCQHQVPRLEAYPFAFISANTKYGLKALFKKIDQVLETAQLRVPTSALNQFVDRVLRRHPPPGRTGKLNRFYYGTQAAVAPPTFVFSVRQTDPIKEGYYRYVEKAIRQYFKGFEGVPLKLRFKGHHGDEEGKKSNA
eukprot:SAG22_NODE_320_length_12472_cov_2.764002_11_plen_448_part_00